MSTLPAAAVDALRARALVEELADIIARMRPDDVAHFGPRSLIGPLLDAAGLSSVHDEPEGRVWQFEGEVNDIVEPMFRLDDGRQMRARACTDALVRRIRAVQPEDEVAAYDAQVAVADVLVALGEALPEVHEHLVLASFASLVNEAGLRNGRVRTSAGLVLEFLVKSDIDHQRSTAPGSPTR